MKTLRERFQFFQQHAGGIVGQSALGAIALARAEVRAQDLDLEVTWEDERGEWDGDCPPPAVHACAFIVDPHAKRYLACLGGIGLNSIHDPYVRVVEAELFLEAIETIASEQAAEMSERARVEYGPELARAA
jgi:hypothetical protein